MSICGSEIFCGVDLGLVGAMSGVKEEVLEAMDSGDPRQVGTVLANFARMGQPGKVWGQQMLRYHMCIWLLLQAPLR